MIRPSVLRVLCAASVAGLVGCYSSNSEARVATSIENAGGSGQSGVVGRSLPQPLRVRVLDQEDDPVGGVHVLWQVTAGNGRVQASTSETTDQGVAEMVFILGSTPGPQAAQASVQGLSGSPVTFTATAITGGSPRPEP